MKTLAGFLVLILPSCVTTTSSGARRFHPTTNALLPDRVGVIYKLNREHEYNGFNVGLSWGLDWDDLLLSSDEE